jgi:hypothetical protein
VSINRPPQDSKVPLAMTTSFWADNPEKMKRNEISSVKCFMKNRLLLVTVILQKYKMPKEASPRRDKVPN